VVEANQELVDTVTRGFSGLHEQLRDRDVKVSQLSDKMIGVEFKIDQLKETLIKVEADMSKAENVQLKLRVDMLEDANKEVKAKQAESGKYIKGLVGSVIVLLIGFLLNFIRIQLK
jgi:hypothetical protein